MPEMTMFTSGNGGASWQRNNVRSVLDLGTRSDDEYLWASASSIGPDGVVLSLFSEWTDGRESAQTAGLYLSTDLTNWSELSLDGLEGNGEETMYIDSVTARSDVVLVTGWYVGDDTSHPFNAAATIG
jgi:hypothetical protein